MTQDTKLLIERLRDYAATGYRRWQGIEAVFNEAADKLESLEARIGDLQLALGLALEWLAPCEPGDSRAVSNEFVAMAAIEAGQTDRLEECREIIRAALSSKGDGR